MCDTSLHLPTTCTTSVAAHSTPAYTLQNTVRCISFGQLQIAQASHAISSGCFAAANNFVQLELTTGFDLLRIDWGLPAV